MFMCEQCGSRYSARHALGLENCPRCRIRGTSSPLSFKAFRLPGERTAAAAKRSLPSR
jgi:ribosomal protein L37AE/L43A